MISFITAIASFRFPQPDFESNYNQPTTSAPMPDGALAEYLDLAILVLVLGLSTYFILKKRSRKLTFLVMLFSLLYFGFWRNGCICPVGSLQNVTMALFDSTYAVPFTVLAFFLLPILFTLFFGRTFCAAVCPLGAIQDVVVLKPVKVPAVIAQVLGMIPYLYLAMAVVLAATGSAFIICRIDPFVAFFRMSGELPMLVFGAILLLVGVFIARPYCRFLCPYGVLLNWASRFSLKHMTITPADCIQCRLCEDSCPFDAIRKPVPAVSPESRAKSKRRLVAVLLVLPLIIAACTFSGRMLHRPLSMLNNTVILAEQIAIEESDAAQTTTLRSDAFRESGKSVETLYADAEKVRASLKRGCSLLGLFIGLVIGLKLAAFSVRRSRSGYEPDRGECLSCGRCFNYCPVKAE
jgi:NosR/NirI family nitrous oxide reductase transcriptional regulator